MDLEHGMHEFNMEIFLLFIFFKAIFFLTKPIHQ